MCYFSLIQSTLYRLPFPISPGVHSYLGHILYWNLIILGGCWGKSTQHCWSNKNLLEVWVKRFPLKTKTKNGYLSILSKIKNSIGFFKVLVRLMSSVMVAPFLNKNVFYSVVVYTYSTVLWYILIVRQFCTLYIDAFSFSKFLFFVSFQHITIWSTDIVTFWDLLYSLLLRNQSDSIFWIGSLCVIKSGSSTRTGDVQLTSCWTDETPRHFPYS